MKNTNSLTFLFVTCLLLSWSSCTAPEELKKEITVKNPAAVERSSATVSVNVEDLAELTAENSIEDLWVQDASGNKLVRQLVDLDQDGDPEELLFQTDLKAGEEKVFTIIAVEGGADQQPESEWITYSKFVPERTDDYTWENDRVAFRTYGPEAQRLVEENEPGGTLSSGIDLWLKRVNRSIIDDWYAGHLDSVGYYHVDHGEGYDPYHVGISRGTGGIGVWKEDSLHTSRNFTDYRTIANGPIRTIFELDYAPWSEYNISETKRISIDLGSNFSKFEISLKPETEVPNYTIGITLHEGGGETKKNMAEGWFRHWETIDDSQVGEGIVIAPSQVDSAFVHTSEVKDQSQFMIVTKPTDQLNYYAGFGWVKSGQVNSVEDWDAILQQQARIMAAPLEVSVK